MTLSVKEIYIRFSSPKYGKGMHETPASTLEEAAGQFCEDADCSNAYELTLDETGKLLASRDVTGEVLQVLKDLISDDQFSKCPHPLVEDHFAAWEQEFESEQRAHEEHVRSESLPSIFI